MTDIDGYALPDELFSALAPEVVGKYALGFLGRKYTTAGSWILMRVPQGRHKRHSRKDNRVPRSEASHPVGEILDVTGSKNKPQKC